MGELGEEIIIQFGRNSLNTFVTCNAVSVSVLLYTYSVGSESCLYYEIIHTDDLGGLDCGTQVWIALPLIWQDYTAKGVSFQVNEHPQKSQ